MTHAALLLFRNQGYLAAFDKYAMSSGQDHRDVSLGIGAAAAASPFLGMIGEKKLVHDPHLNPNVTHASLKDLERMAQPGDILLVSRPSWEGFKATQSPFSGSEFFHAAAINGKRKGKATILDAGEALRGDDGRHIPTPQAASNQSRTLRAHMAHHKYKDAVLIRPERPMTPEQQATYLEELAKRTNREYSFSKGIHATFRDLFVPKIFRSGKDRVKRHLEKNVCKDQMCSSFPAEAHAAAGTASGFRGKLPGEMLPADFLREGSGFVPVAASLGHQTRAYKGLLDRAAYRYGSRAALGAALGGAAYGTAQDPVMAASVVGGLAAPELAARVVAHQLKKGIPYEGLDYSEWPKKDILEYGPQVVPSTKTLARKLFLTTAADTPEVIRALRRNALTRTLPLALATGGGIYYGGSKLRDAIQRRFSEK
jgi:hypothetical protein